MWGICPTLCNKVWGIPAILRPRINTVPVYSHKALAYQILHVALSGEPLQRVSKSQPWGQIWPHPRGHKFYLDL